MGDMRGEQQVDWLNERERELARRISGANGNISCDDDEDRRRPQIRAGDRRQVPSAAPMGHKRDNRRGQGNHNIAITIAQRRIQERKNALDRHVSRTSDTNNTHQVRVAPPVAIAFRASRQQKSQVSAPLALFLLACALCALFDALHNQHIQQHHYFSVQAFNLDAQSAVIHAGPEDSYFGYAVAQHRDRGLNWLLVGAPKAQTNQPRVKAAGAVYNCSPSASTACQQIPMDPLGPATIRLGDEQVQQDDKSHQWFGASLSSASDGSFVACAPNYVYFSYNFKRRDPVGVCWLSRGSFAGFLNYSSCRRNDLWGHHHLGSCQAGFASALSKDGSRLFMAAPGAHVWQGQVFAHNLKNDLVNTTSAVNPHSEDDSYLGYSLALGRFSAGSASSASSANSANSADTDLAIGVPHGADHSGKIMLVDRELRTLRNITGEQLGSYFGYSLATIDLNGDGLDDLVIGAPLYYNATTSHKEPHFDRGRVYVAYQSARHELQLTSRLDGQKNRARFGTALANCGDLNRDGVPDLAVGAPYDGPEQRGAVYIYMGRKGSHLSDGAAYDQVIFAESVRPEGHLLRSFGFSLSGSLDMDGNQYPDLLVGDYKAARAILLKARPVVNVATSITFEPENLNLDDRPCSLPLHPNVSVSCLTVHYCTKYGGLNVDNRLAFVYDIKLDTDNKGAPRLFFLEPNTENRNEQRNTSLVTKDVQQCRSFKAYVAPQVRDKLTPLRVDIEYNLADQSNSADSQSSSSSSYDYITGQQKLRPVLNRPAGGQAPNKMSRVALIQKNCGRDNVCVPDLKLSVKPRADSYTMGTNEKLMLDVTVKNNAEDAYESMFYLNMPMTINYINVNKSRPDAPYPICYGAKPDLTGENVLSCDLGNPQARNELVKFTVIMEPSRQVQFVSPDFTFVAHVNSTNPEADDRHREDNQVAIGIPVRVEVQLVLSGSSQPPLVAFNTTRHEQLKEVADRPRPLSEADVGQEVYHVHQLQNRGPSTISDIAVSILWPNGTKDGREYLLYLVDEPFTSGNVKCKPAPEGAINPLGLKYLRGNSVNSYTTIQRGSSNNSQTMNSLFRFRRQTTSESRDAQPEAQAQMATSTVDEAVMQQVNSLTCGPNQCTRFECNVYDLGSNEIATIRIRSRLFDETISKSATREFDISSKLVAQIKLLPYNVSAASMPPYVHKVETQVHTSGLAIQDLLPWWLIALSVLLGILLFALLACFLKYLGFFARKRVPKAAEREPLTPTRWSDYPYTPGDTAL